MEWEKFHASHYRPHLVVAKLSAGANLESVTNRVELLKRLATELDIVGNYSIREDGGTVEAAFERDVDAKMFGDSLLANAGAPSADWASQSRFRFGRKAQQRIVEALRSSRLRMARHPPTDR
jgi:hypothetical protein